MAAVTAPNAVFIGRILNPDTAAACGALKANRPCRFPQFYFLARVVLTGPCQINFSLIVYRGVFLVSPVKPLRATLKPAPFKLKSS